MTFVLLILDFLGLGNAGEIEQKISDIKQTRKAITILLSDPDLNSQTVEIESYITIKK